MKYLVMLNAPQSTYIHYYLCKYSSEGYVWTQHKHEAYLFNKEEADEQIEKKPYVAQPFETIYAIPYERI